MSEPNPYESPTAPVTDQTQDQAPPVDEKDKHLQGLGGWLILVGIGVVFSPLRILLIFVPLYSEIFTNGSWEQLTSPHSVSYTPFYATFLIAEMTVNIAVFLASVYLIYLFFSKHHLFPKVYIALAAFSIALIPLDAWLASQVFEDLEVFDQETATEFAKAVLTGLIWIPYMLVSRRVKVTFINKRTNTPTP